VQVFDAQDAAEFAARAMAEGRRAKAVTNRLIHEAVRERRAKDNVTVMLIDFGRTGEAGEGAAAAGEGAAGEQPAGAAAADEEAQRALAADCNT
jgi:hypothetical protein